VTRVNPAQPDQPLPTASYVRIAILLGVVCIGTLCLYVFLIPWLTEAGIQNQVFYLVLVLWGLFCAAFLNGVMRTYARVRQDYRGIKWELGGPAAIAFLLVWGGFRLVPPTPELFDLTVRPYGADGVGSIISSGKITIDLDNDRRSEAISSKGEADFKGIPAKFRGATVGVLPQVDGYKQVWQRLKLKGTVLDVTLQRAPPPVTRLTGSIIPPPKDWARLRIMVDGQAGEGKVDELGRFDFQVNGRDGDTIRLKIYDDTKLVFDDYQTLSGPLTLTLHRK